jgi:hypothetical protein
MIGREPSCFAQELYQGHATGEGKYLKTGTPGYLLHGSATPAFVYAVGADVKDASGTSSA